METLKPEQFEGAEEKHIPFPYVEGKWMLGVSLALILGGAVGNFIDRVIRKEVVDFIHTYVFGYNFPVFNIADSALVIGVIMLMIQMLLEERESKEKSYGENGTHHS